MKGYTTEIKRTFEALPFNHIIVANELYSSKLNEIPEKTFYKVVGRLAQNGQIVHLTKGIYYKPKHTKYGIVPISENEIVEYYTDDSNGMLIGYRMYNSKGITTQIGKNVILLSKNLAEEKKTIGNVKVEKANINFTDKNIETIEMLEILQNYKGIEDLNKKAFLNHAAIFAKKYSDEAAIYVIEHRKYKRSTIAFLKRILDDMDVNNSLGRYLSDLSNYAIPNVEGLNEVTH
ncbi:MAG: DUF6088 family protein [Bacillota bacterium]|nr:DUF6088 family protein [Bacillota bacterium]